MRDILLYCDEGVDLSSYRFTLKGLSEELDPLRYTIRPVNHKYFLSPQWENKTAMVVVPGGRDVPYHLKLQGAANQRLLQFIAGGGTYLGICAGAYYGAAAIEFEKGSPLEITGMRELAFFPGKAAGPVYDGAFAREAPIRWRGEEQITPLYFNGGCCFISPEEHPNTTVLATYVDVKLPAIIRCEVGRGKAILSGVHPEFNTRHDSSRLIFWKMFLNYILI